MTRIQQVVDLLFERFPAEDLGGGPERYQFDRLRDTLAMAVDWPSTLRRLYQAERCDELAVGLMWITDRLERDEARLDPMPEEEEVFQRGARLALGLPDLAFSGFGGAVEASPEAGPLPSLPEPSLTFEAAPAEPAELPPIVSEETLPEVTVTAEAPAPEIPMGGEDDGGTSDPEIFGRLLERFLESVQSGADDRQELLARLRVNARAVRADSGAGEEYQRYVELLDDFLGYIETHQLLDDVRVMNLVTNFQEPFGQWMAAAEADRTGLLDQCVEMHREFRTMFE